MKSNEEGYNDDRLKFSKTDCFTFERRKLERYFGIWFEYNATKSFFNTLNFYKFLTKNQNTLCFFEKVKNSLNINNWFHCLWKYPTKIHRNTPT